MAYTATTTDPTSWGALSTESESWADNKVFSYLVGSAVSITKGDFIKLASSTTNTIAKCNSSSDAASFIGIAMGDLDNSGGTVASDTMVGVLREGIARVDILVASSSGTQKATVNFDDLLYLADTETDQDIRGQALTGTANNQPIARSIDKIDVPSATDLFGGRIYINTLLKSTLIQ